jgi:hypothetical protein
VLNLEFSLRWRLVCTAVQFEQSLTIQKEIYRLHFQDWNVLEEGTSRSKLHLILPPWRWRHYVPSESRALSKQKEITTQMIVMFQMYLTNIHVHHHCVKFVLLWTESTGSFRATETFLYLYLENRHQEAVRSQKLMFIDNFQFSGQNKVSPKIYNIFRNILMKIHSIQEYTSHTQCLTYCWTWFLCLTLSHASI